MNNPTKEEIIDALAKLQVALLRELDISTKEMQIKQDKIHAHNEVLLARENLNSLKLT